MGVFNLKAKGPAITRTHALKCVPAKSTHVRIDRSKPAETLLAYPVEPRPWMAYLIRRLGGPTDQTRTKKLQLDALGTAVWDLIDGRRSVQNIIKRFAAQFQLHHKEAEVSVTRFIRELGRRGIIGLK